MEDLGEKRGYPVHPGLFCSKIVSRYLSDNPGKKAQPGDYRKAKIKPKWHCSLKIEYESGGV